MDRLLLKETGAESHRVGLDIGNHSVKGIEVAEEDMGTVIRSAGLSVIMRPLRRAGSEDRRAVIRSIKHLWSSAKFRTRKVVLALPASVVHTSLVDISASDDDELDKISRDRVADETPFCAEEAIIDYRVMSCRTIESKSVYSVMLISAHSPAVNGALDLAGDAGLDPVAVDIGFMASLRGFGAQKSDNSQLWGNQPNAHCAMGATTTTVTVGRGESIEFARSIPIGGDNFTERVVETARVDWSTAERLKSDPRTHVTKDGILSTYFNEMNIDVPCSYVLSRLSEEILRSLRCFSGGFPEGSYLGTINSITISGGGSLMEGLSDALGSYGVKVRSEADCTHSKLPFSQAPMFATALGLALGDYWSRESKRSGRRAA